MSDDAATILAKNLGYQLQSKSYDSRSGEARGWTFVKDMHDEHPLFLIVKLTPTGEFVAKVDKITNLVTSTSGEFSFPHKNFAMFEDQVARMVMLPKSG